MILGVIDSVAQEWRSDSRSHMTQCSVSPCRAMPMAIQFSILIMLHSALVLITTAEDYKCLPLVLRKTCCWINETYLARNVIIFASILINFLGAILNIVSIPSPPTLWCPGCTQGSRVRGACGFFTAVLGTGYLHVPGPAPSLGTERKDVATVRTVRFTGGKSSLSQWERLFAPFNFCTVSGQSITMVNKGSH